MRISYYCEHCHKHLRSGDHAACRKAIKQKRREENEESRLAAGERTRQRYAGGSYGKALAKQEGTR